VYVENYVTSVLLLLFVQVIVTMKKKSMRDTTEKNINKINKNKKIKNNFLYSFIQLYFYVHNQVSQL